MPTGGFIDITILFEGANGPEQVTRKLATWGASIDDLTEPFQQIGEDFLADFALNMATEGGVLAQGGSGWADLAPSTVAERERLGFGGAHPILWRTGALAESLAAQDAPGNVFSASRTSLNVGTDLFYAQFHQSGTTRMPRRQLVGITYNRRALLLARLNEFIQTQALAQGILVGGV